MDSMNVDDNININQTFANPSPKKKLYPVAKMKASGRKPWSVDRTNIQRDRHVHVGPRPSGSRQSDNDGVPRWSVKSFKGHCAPYNDHANWVQDPFNSKIYMIGGIRPADEGSESSDSHDSEDWEPTSDFFCYDTRTMEWEDLTDDLVYREPYDPYCSTEIRRPKKHLPACSQPGCTLWRLEDTSFIFMFGGCDLETTCPSSQVVIINLHAREWWYERFNQDPTPRIAPAIVAIENRVYVFGGYRSYDEDPLACYTYSVAEWNPTTPGSRWNWVHCDVPYPALLFEKCIGEAVSVYGGKIIVLTPGRTNGLDKRVLEFNHENLFYFRPNLFEFQPLKYDSGTPPRDIQWYSIFDLQSPFPDNLPSNSPPSSSDTSRKRGRPRKPLANTSAASQSTIPSTRAKKPSTSASIPPSIVICAWLNQPSNPEQESADEEYNSPEIYRFTFFPDDKFECLNVKARISDLNRDFQGCSYVTPGFLCLLGNHQSSRESDSEKTWNIYLDVPL